MSRNFNILLLQKQLKHLLLSILFLFLFINKTFAFDFQIGISFDRYFPDKWMYSLYESYPNLPYKDTVYQGLPWGIHVFFLDYTLDGSNQVDLRFDYKIISPDGNTFYDSTGIVAISETIQKKAGILLSYVIPMVVFDKDDALGEYKIEVKAIDKIEKKSKTKKEKIILGAYPDKKSFFFNDTTLNIWIHSYCFEPDPGRAVIAFNYFINSQLCDDGKIFWPVFYFFQCLFLDNSFLVERLLNNFSKKSEKLQGYIVFLLRAIEFDKSLTNEAISDSLWKKYDEVGKAGFYNPFEYAFANKTNKMVEYAFYYYGKYVMIRFLIGCLALDTKKGYKNFIEDCSKYGEDCSKCVDRETGNALHTEATKILNKIFPRHPLANEYCIYAFKNDNLDKGAKKNLKKIVSLKPLFK